MIEKPSLTFSEALNKATNDIFIGDSGINVPAVTE